MRDYLSFAEKEIKAARRSRICSLEVRHLRKARAMIQARLREIARRRRRGKADRS